MGKIRNWSRGGKRVPAVVHCKQQLPSDPFSNTCYLGRRGALQQRNALFHQRWSHQMAFRLVVGSIPWCSEFPTCYFYVSVGSLQARWPSTPPKMAKKRDFLWRKQGILHWIHLQFFSPLLHNRGRNHRRLHKTTLSQYWTRSAVLIYCHFLSIASQVWAIFATSTKFPESRIFPVLTPLAVLSSRLRTL